MKKKVLMISSNHPNRDPRIDWEASSIAKKYSSTVLGINTEISKGPKRIKKHGYTQLVFNKQFSRKNIRLLSFYLNYFLHSNIYGKTLIVLSGLMFLPIFCFVNLFKIIKLLFRFPQKTGNEEAAIKLSTTALFFKTIYEGILLIDHFNHYFAFIFNELYLYIDSEGIVADLIHCNDLDTLLVGLVIKHKKKSKLVYDAHELWPESIPVNNIYLKIYLRLYEKGITNIADAVFTVSPQLAEIMEKWYNLKKVYFLPNAEIFVKGRKIFHTDIQSHVKKRLVFLYQGGYAKFRGIENLIRYWKFIDTKKALLVLRGRPNDYSAALKKLADDQIKKGSIIFSEYVDEKYLVNAAMEADVGVIPYEPVNLNHELGFFNKISQYSQAGIAFLSNSLVNVNKIIQKYNCGEIYNSNNKRSFIRAVNKLINNENLLAQYKDNSFRCGSEYLNWQNTGKIYLEVCSKLLD